MLIILNFICPDLIWNYFHPKHFHNDGCYSCDKTILTSVTQKTFVKKTCWHYQKIWIRLQLKRWQRTHHLSNMSIFAMVELLKTKWLSPEGALWLSIKLMMSPHKSPDFITTTVTKNIDRIIFNSLSGNPTKWSNTLKQFVSNLATNYLSVSNHFVRLALKGLSNHGDSTS